MSVKIALKGAKSALDAQDYETVVVRSNEVIASDPENYFAYVFLGRAFEKQSKESLAVEAYRKATSIKPNEELAWKGLCNVYASQDSRGVDGHTLASLELAKIFANKDDIEQCQTIVDKLVAYAKEHGTRKEYKDALCTLLPTSPIYEFLEGRIQPASLTFIRIGELTELDEKERINKEIGERRTRLGAKLGQVTNEVKREVFSGSNLELIYQDVINWTSDDELRREYEEKLFKRVYEHLTVLPIEEKPDKRSQVMKLANDIVVIKHPFQLAWDLHLEWKDLNDTDELDRGVLEEYAAFFPGSGLSKILQAHLGHLIQPVKAQQVNEDFKDLETPPPKEVSELNAEDRLIMFVDGLEDFKESAFANRLVSDFYLQISEFESCVDTSRRGLGCLRGEVNNSGLQFEKNHDAINLNLATSLVYYQAPKNHPEAQALFNDILARTPTSTRALLGLGLILEEEEDYERASISLESALSRDPDNIRIRVEAAWCKVLTGEVTKGLEALESCLQSLESSRELDLKALTLYRIGRCLWDLDTDKKARKDRTRSYARFIGALKANPVLAPAYTSLGIYYADYGKDKKRARQCFQKAFELSSTEVQAAERLARGFADDSDWELVEIVALRVIESGIAKPAPGSKRKGVSWPFSALGVAQMNKQEYPQAVISFQSALRISANDYNAWVGLGESYHSSGRYIAAQKTLEHAMTINMNGKTHSLEKSWFAEYMLSNVHRELGDYEEAIDGYQRVLEVRPNEYGIAIALLQTWVERAWNALETGLFGLSLDCAKSALKVAAGIFQHAVAISNVFSIWKAVGDALSIATALPGTVGDIPVDLIEPLIAHQDTVYARDTDNVDNVTKERFVELLNRSVPQNTVTLDIVVAGAILAYKCAITASMHEFHAQAVAWYNLGWFENKAGHYLKQTTTSSLKPSLLAKASVRCFKRAIELEAGNADFWNALGVATTTLNTKVAQHSLVRSLHLNERSARTWTNLGALYLIKGDYELAHNAFARAQSTDPDCAHAWIGEGLVAAKLGDTNEALSHFRHAAEISNAASALVTSRVSLSTFDQLLSAPIPTNNQAELANLVLNLNQLSVTVASPSPYKHLLALIQERLSDVDSSKMLLTDLCAETESRFEDTEDTVYLLQFAQAQADLARTELANKSYDSAIEHATTSLDLTTDADPALPVSRIRTLRLSAHLTCGLAQYHLSSLSESLDSFRQALAESDNDPAVTCLVSQVLWATGGAEEKGVARDQLFEVIEMIPGHAQATLLIGAMAALDNDQETLEAVTQDLRTLRTESHADSHSHSYSHSDPKGAKPNDVEELLAAFAHLASEQKDNKNNRDDIADNARTAIMLSPSDPNAWMQLSTCFTGLLYGDASVERQGDVTVDSDVADMACVTAQRLVPPVGAIDASSLSRMMAGTGKVHDAQRAVMVCPWMEDGWKGLVEVLSR